jgi:chromosome segregation ATPase
MVQISSLQTQVTDLQTSLTAAENALHAANRTTQVSQERCLGILHDLHNAHANIADLKSRAATEAIEKNNLLQQVGHLKDEVSRLQSGVEQITQLARGVGSSIVVHLYVCLPFAFAVDPAVVA